MGRLEQLRTLSFQEWRFLVTALLLLPVLKLSLRGWGFKRVYARLELASPMVAGPTEALSDSDILSLVHMVDIAAYHGLVLANCLPRSLATWWLLRRRGVDSEIRFGVDRQSSDFHAHAWVEHKGSVINDSDDVHQRFAALE